ncbi:MAG TPA: DMT family transporter [Gemmatimonadaceae bacterium]|nr:DMT family transporter [Gemmatimonadaceae bacterium]
MRRSPGWVLAAALLGISFAGPLVRLSAADPLAIGVWRLAFSLVIVAIALLVTGQWREWKNITGREAAFAIAAGVALAFHFWAWNTSIHLTTIAASVTLVSLQPPIVIAISGIFLREVPSRRQVLGIALAVVGAMVIAIPDWRSTSGEATRGAFLGNMLAISAAITAAIYYTIGRHLRTKYGIWSYVGLCYGACTITLLIMAWLSHAPLAPQPPREMAIFLGLAIGPMLLGHTGLNWALKYMPAYVVNLIVLGEPLGATILGALIPAIRQIPSVATIIGGVIVLSGVLVAASAAVSVKGSRA